MDSIIKFQQLFSLKDRASSFSVYLIYFSYFVLPFLFYIDPNWADFENVKLLYVSLINVILFIVLFLQSLSTVKSVFEFRVIHIIWGLFAFSILVSYVAAQNKYISLWGYDALPIGSVYSHFSLAFFAVASVQILKQSARIKGLILVLFFGGVCLALIVFLQHFGINIFTGHSTAFDETRALGTIGQPVGLGTYLGAIALMGIIIFFQSEKFFFFGFLNFLLIFATFFSGSRAPIYALILLFVGVIFFKLFFIRTKVTRENIAKTLLILFIFTLAHIYTTQNENSVLKHKTSVEQIGLGFKVRFEYWKVGLEIFKHHPLIGVGPENFQLHYEKYMPLSHNYFETWKNAISKAHNELIQIAVTQGLLGLGIYLFLHLWVLNAALSLKTRAQIMESTQAQSAVVGFLYLSLANFFAFNLANTQLLFFLFPTIIATGMNFPVITFRVSRFLRIICSFVVLIIVGFYSLNYGERLISLILARSANKYIEYGEYPKALELVNRSINYNPINYGLYCLRAGLIMDSYRILFAKDQRYAENKNFFYDDADENIKLCKELSSKHYLLYDILARYYRRFSELRPEFNDQGIQALSEAIELYPKHPVAYVNLALFSKNKLDFKKAEQLIDQALALKEDYFAALIERFALNYDLGKKSDNINFLHNLKLKLNLYMTRVDFQESANTLMNGLMQEAVQRSDHEAEAKIREIAEEINGYVKF